MNKLFAIAFTCIYLLLSVGVAKTTHYCMGREKSTEIFSFSAEKCPCSLYLPENSGCCSDSHEILIVDDTQNLIAGVSAVVPEFFLMGSLYEIESGQVIVQPIIQNVTDFSPPPKEPLYQLHCSIVFYDGELS